MLGLRFEETRVYQEAKAEEALKLVLCQLVRRLKQDLAEEVRSQVTALSLPQLEELAEALLDFEQPEELLAWLQQQGDRP
jgi:predicted transposase YdaD